jgi:hypothetical protein
MALMWCGWWCWLNGQTDGIGVGDDDTEERSRTSPSMVQKRILRRHGGNKTLQKKKIKTAFF